MGESEQKLLEIKNLSKNFGGINAVEDFSMSMEKGELHCLIGPNGAGKTTVFKMITGILPVSSGKIVFEGQDITKEATVKRAQRGISIKMQVPGLFGDLTLRENIRIAAQNFVKKSELETEIDRLIELVHIQDLGNPCVKNMTHGQQQWLEIAMALAPNPKLLLLDEPAAGLGPEETEYTAQLIEQLNAAGLGVLFIEHDMNFVRRIAKDVTVLHYGKKFAEGPMEQIEKDEGVIRIYLGN
nr:ABC transporter ATP-binding protein [uncultured Blautia sp.]